MPLKKASLKPNEIAIYDEALIYTRGDYWQMRMWLSKEKKYARFNAMMSWLHKRSETYIEAFDFKKLPKVDTGDEKNRRNTFTDEEIVDIKTELETYIKEGKQDLSLYGNLNKVITAYYLLIAIITGLRRGEQLQLTWADISWMEKHVKGEEDENPYALTQRKQKGGTAVLCLLAKSYARSCSPTSKRTHPKTNSTNCSIPKSA